MESFTFKVEERNFKAVISYDRYSMILETKPNLFMRLFLKLLGVKVKILKDKEN